MKKTTLQKQLTIGLLIIAGTIYGQATPTNNLVRLISLGTGSESNTLDFDDTNLSIDAQGVVTVTDAVPDFSPIQASGVTTGVVTLPDALSKTFFMRIKPISVVDQTEGANYGAIVTSGGIDRSGAGDLGVRLIDAPVNSNYGIDVGEGYGFGFAIPNLPSTITLQITRFYFSTFGPGESAVIVNRADTSKRITIAGPAAGTNLIADVSSLGIYGTGGLNPLNMVTVFNNTPTTNASLNFRITNIEFKLIETSSLKVADFASEFDTSFVVSPNPVSDYISIDYNSNEFKDVTATLTDVNGRLIDVNSSKRSSESNKILLNASSLESGVYFVKISDDKNTTTKKIIKK